MKALMLLIFVGLASCANKEKALVVNAPAFKKIPFDLATDFRNTIALKIKPVREYQYWAYISHSHGHWEIIKEGGDTLVKKNIHVKQDTFGFFQGCHPNFCCNYIVTLEKGVEKVIDTNEGFRAFLGTIDNLEEAVLLAISHGYWLDPDIRGSAFRINNGNYEMHLLKFSSHPLQKESVEVIVNKNGTIKTKSLGVYCKGKPECY